MQVAVSALGEGEDPVNMVDANIGVWRSQWKFACLPGGSRY